MLGDRAGAAGGFAHVKFVFNTIKVLFVVPCRWLSSRWGLGGVGSPVTSPLPDAEAVWGRGLFLRPFSGSSLKGAHVTRTGHSPLARMSRF